MEEIISAQNQITNHIKDIENKSIISLTAHTNAKSTASLNSFSKGSEKIYEIAVNDTMAQTKKYGKKVDSLGIVQNSIADIISLKSLTSGAFATNAMGFMKNMFKTIMSSITKMVSKVSSMLSNPSGMLNSLMNFATGLFNSLVSKLKLIMASMINKFMKVLNAMVDNIIGRLKAIKAMVMQQYAALKKGLDKAKKLKDDFFKRAKGASSTAKEIQANIPTSTGAMKAQASALKGSVSEKIVAPKLKVDLNLTIGYIENPLAKILGFVSSLIPVVQIKKIEEPKPNDAKAEYGKITAVVRQDGSSEICNSTPGCVEKISRHPSGSYNAVLNDGATHTKTAADKQEITVGNWNITTEKDKIEIICGENKIEIRKDLKENYKGNVDTNIDGTRHTVIKKDVNDDFKANYTSKISGKVDSTVEGDNKETISGNSEETVKGTKKEIYKKSLTIQVIGNINISCTGNATISSKGNTIINGSKIMLG